MAAEHLDQLMSLIDNDSGLETNMETASGNQQNEETFYSTMDDVSWMANRSGSSDLDKTMEISESKDAVEESPTKITERLRELDRQRIALEGKLKSVEYRRQLVDIDFSADNTCNLTSLRKQQSVVSRNDDSDDEQTVASGDLVCPSKKVLINPMQKRESRIKTEPISNGKIPADIFDPKFGIRVRVPKVSSSTFDVYCGGMQKLKLSDLRPGFGPTGEWVTMGVVVEKTGYRKSANNNEYMIWKLSDLLNCQDSPTKLLLFGDCLRQRWKLPVSTTIALLGPDWIDSDQKEGGITLKAVRGSQLVEIGQCPDLSFCKGVKMNGGGKCHRFINIAFGDYCAFHLASAAKSMASRRGAFQNQGNGPPRCWQRTLRDYDDKIQKTSGFTFGHTKTSTRLSALSTISANESTKLAGMLKTQTAGGRNLMKQLNKDVESKKQYVSAEKSKVKSIREFVNSQKVTIIRPPDNAVDKNRTLDAKQRAMLIVNRSGGVSKSDPNAIIALDKGSKTKKTAGESAPSASPTRKRTKFGGDNMDDDKLRAIIAKKSTHEAQVDEQERAYEAVYFNSMVVKEKLQTNVTELMEVKNCKVISCKKCNYTWHSQSELCKRQGHLISKHQAEKRFFKCQQCKNRLICYTRHPVRPCKQCSARNFLRVGMKDEAKAPQLPGESLKVRGDEQAFVH